MRVPGDLAGSASTHRALLLAEAISEFLCNRNHSHFSRIDIGFLIITMYFLPMLKTFCLFCRLFSMCIFSLFCFLRQTLTKPRLDIQSRMTFNPNLLPLPSVRISDMHCHIWFYVPPGIRRRVLCMLGELGVPPTLVVYSFIYFVMGSHCVAQQALNLQSPCFRLCGTWISGAQLSHPVCPDVLICFIIIGNV